ncbi:MAG: glycosyltransferase [Candidatus Nanopelagicales bacterium]
MRVTSPPIERATTQTATIEIVIPVFNEQACLADSIARLCRYLDGFPIRTSVTIADNASTDGTRAIAERLAASDERIRAVHLDRKGRGRALRQVWGASDATVVAYMDVDLSTDLDALLPLVAPLVSGHSDVAIGTRLARGSHITRGPKREFISRTYNRMLRMFMGVGFTDAQCGFKAVRTDRVRELLPLVADDEWFFDTELLLIAERAGLRIHEVPVDWTDDPDSRVDIFDTARKDVRGMARVGRGLMNGSIPLDRINARPRVEADRRARLAGQILRFVVVGVGSTLIFSGLFWLFRGFAGPQTASIAALLLATVANTAVNRRFTFGLRGRDHAVRHQLQGFAVLGVALLLTSGSLAVLHTLHPTVSRGTEVVALTAANLAATLLRFVLFRGWVFRSATPAAELGRPQPADGADAASTERTSA